MGLQVSAQQVRLWALRREEGEDRGWGHASPGACVPQFLRNKPCWMKTRQTVLRAYKAPVFLSCDPFRAQGLHHHPQTCTQCPGYGWLRSIHPTPPRSSRLQPSLVLSSPCSWDANRKEQKHPRGFALYLANNKAEKPTLSQHRARDGTASQEADPS